MAHETLKAIIDENIKTNGSQSITGSVLNGVLNAMVDEIPEGGGGDASKFDVIDVTAPPTEYTGAKVSADSADNTPALYALMAWAVANYKNPVLRFPMGVYNFASVQMFTFTPSNTIAESLRITGEDATIKFTGQEQNANSGWFHIYYQNTTETRNDFSVEIDHLSFLRTNVTADGTHTHFYWIWGQGSQLADIYLDRIDVHDCTFRGQCAGAIIIGYARQCFIERNKFYNCYEAASDDSGFIIHNNICYNSVIRKNYMYIDDTKPICGAGIVSEYQTGNCVIEENYVYGYDRGIHIELTQRRALQRVISNHIENCRTGIVSWNALSDLELIGNSILTSESWDGDSRSTYAESNKGGISFPTYARNKSVRIINNTIQLYNGGVPFSLTARGTYQGAYVCPHNFEIAYNEFYTDYTKEGSQTGSFFCPVMSKIHHNVWYGWLFNLYGAYWTEIYKNEFHFAEYSSSVQLSGGGFFYPGSGEYAGETTLAYAQRVIPGMRGLDFVSYMGSRIYENKFFGFIANGAGLKSLEGMIFKNEFHYRGGKADGTTASGIIRTGTLYPSDNSAGIAIDNIVYEYEGHSCDAITYQGIDRNVYYTVDGQGNKTLRLNTNLGYYNTNKYTMAETIETERKLAHNITCIAPTVPTTGAKWDKGNYIPGDITLNSKWFPGSTLPHHWLCITGGKGIAGDGETQSVWLPIYDNTTIQKAGGTTAQRPTLASGDVGFTYYDSTLGKTIVWDGTAWVNLDGTPLA